MDSLKRMITMSKKFLTLHISLLLLLPSLTFAETFSLNLRYTSPSQVSSTDSNIKIGISNITDKRQRENKSLFGERINYSGSKDYFAPAGISVEDAVTGMVAEYFKKRGFQGKRVEKWDLDANNLKGDWGDIVVGGEILELWSDVMSKFMSNKHTVKAKLKIVIADPKEKRILLTDTITTSLEMTEPLFHEESVEKMINEAASSCIDNILENNTLKKILSEAK